MQWSDIATQIADALQQPFTPKTPRQVSGGDINVAYLLEDSGQRLFIKLNQAHRLPMFEAEYQALLEMKAGNTIQVPAPLCCGVSGPHAFIVMEYIEFAAAQRGCQDRLGQQLAKLHRITAEQFGWHRDNTIGTTQQCNRQRDDWLTFWRDQRIGRQLQLLAARGHQGVIQSLGSELLAAMPSLLNGHQPLPSMLHGDLWSGNYAFNLQGEPLLFDPAFYYGDRETDLAMTELFGGFSVAFYDAYQAAYPLDEGYPQRKNLYNLYHILNHGNLFGGHYIDQAEQMITTLLLPKNLG